MKRFPSYAGIVTRAQAEGEGLSVADATALLHRIAYVKQRLAIAAAMFLPSTPEWEVKGVLALHGWLDADHAAMLYGRISEMREPPPGPWDIPDPRLEAALDEVLAAETTAARLGAIYYAVRPAMRSAISVYVELTNRLCDQPSVRLLRTVALEEADTVDRWTEQLAPDEAETLEWGRHVRTALGGAGGITGLELASEPPPWRFQRPYAPRIVPTRDARFTGLYDTGTPADVVYLDEARAVDERNAALMFKRLREMDVPEVLAGIVAERWAAERNSDTRRLPWSYYTGMLRQMWDEARHAMLGQALMESRDIDWSALPVNVTFSWKLARYCSPLERHILLYAIEQSLMPRDRGKPYEHRVASESGDRLSMLFHDFDWADEVLHVDIARRCLKPELDGGLKEAQRRADALWTRIAEALERDPMPAETDSAALNDWWPRYVKQVLGRDVLPVPETNFKDWRPLD